MFADVWLLIRIRNNKSQTYFTLLLKVKPKNGPKLQTLGEKSQAFLLKHMGTFINFLLHVNGNKLWICVEVFSWVD